MNELGHSFRARVLASNIPNCTVTQTDENHFAFATEHALGAVNFYDLGEDIPEIVELSIIDPEAPDEPKFFLHFELEDEARANDLFSEMLEQLQQQDQFDTTRVLLCCTAGFTTSMFANRLQEAAKTLSLDYSFEALPLEQAKTEGGSYDAVLLAPQVGYQRKDVVEAFPQAVVVPIPAKIFAAYNAGACLKMVMHLLSDNTVFPLEDKNNLKLVREIKNDKRIMVIIVVKRPQNTWLGWRVYENGEVKDYGSVTKCRHDIRDIDDLLATMPIKGWNMNDFDAVGIALPGIVSRGTVINTWAYEKEDGTPSTTPREETHYELGRSLSKKYGTKVFVDNNANAAAVGCYVSQTEYDSVVLHTQQTGYLLGGQGIVVDGHLLKGKGNFAGEIGPLFSVLHHQEPGTLDEQAWTPEGLRQVVAPLLVADISLVAPDAIYVAVDLLDDMDALREEIGRHFVRDQKDCLPDLIHVTDYRERIALGELALCLQKLHNPRPHRKH
ncbi:MAG: ROK family protein [Coriobacteriales bacterium]|nr:ROK family protein [Coriobacteriales bacterium]